MRILTGWAISCCFLCGCSNDATKPAPNYNPAAERDDYPEPAGSDTRPADAQDESRPPPRGSGSVIKDFQNLDEDALRKASEEFTADGIQPSDAGPEKTPE